MDIRCRKTNCKYNDRLTCTAEGILVSPKIVCKAYSGVEGKGRDYSKNLFEAPTPNFAGYRHTKKLSLKCEAKCLFNRDGNCIANGITVNDLDDTAKCITFAKP